jgi:hypothetical protein
MNFGMVITRPFPEELTMIPIPPLKIDLADHRGYSSAGVFARDSSGRIGVTGAAHAIPKRAQPRVGGRHGKVLSHDDRFTDSCFIALPTLTLSE